MVGSQVMRSICRVYACRKGREMHACSHRKGGRDSPLLGGVLELHRRFDRQPTPLAEILEFGTIPMTGKRPTILSPAWRVASAATAAQGIGPRVSLVT